MGTINIGQESTSPSTPSAGRAKMYLKDDGYFYYKTDDGNEERFGITSDATVDLKNNYYVSKSGNDSSATGTINQPFLTIAACIAYINANETPSADDNFCIIVSAGNFTEGTLALPRFVSMWGQGYRTRIIASSTNIDLITSTGAVTIKDLLLTGVTNPSNYLIKVEASTSTRVTVQSVAFSPYETIGEVSNGIYASSTSETVSVRTTNVDFEGVSNYCIHLVDNADMTSFTTRVIDCGDATFLKAEGNCSYGIHQLETNAIGVGVNHGNTGDSSASNVDLISATVPVIKNNSGRLILTSVSLDSSKTQITNFLNIDGFIYDNLEDEATVHVLDEFSVGSIGNGHECTLGEGDSTSLGMKVYSYNGTAYTDVSTEASSPSGSTFSFPIAGTERILYLSSMRTVVGTTTPVKFFGIKSYFDSAASDDGTYVCEYWNGTDWATTETLSTESGGNYYPYGNALFQRTGTEQIRFDDFMKDDWAINDPVGYGTSLYWIRFRASVIGTTLPVFEKWKIHTSRTEINPDGFKEMYGLAREITSIPLPNFQSANNSPADGDLYFETKMGVGFKENKFEDNVVDQSSQIIYLPAGVDTSCPLRFKAVFTIDNASLEETLWTIQWVVCKEGGYIYTSAANAPDDNPDVMTKEVSVIPNGVQRQFTLKTAMPIPNFISRNAEGTPDVLGIQIQRNGTTDNNPGNCIMARAQVFCVKWCNGGHL